MVESSQGNPLKGSVILIPSSSSSSSSSPPPSPSSSSLSIHGVLWTDITTRVNSNHQPHSFFAWNKQTKNQLEREDDYTKDWFYDNACDPWYGSLCKRLWRVLLTGEDEIWNPFSTADLPTIPGSSSIFLFPQVCPSIIWLWNWKNIKSLVTRRKVHLGSKFHPSLAIPGDTHHPSYKMFSCPLSSNSGGHSSCSGVDPLLYFCF